VPKNILLIEPPFNRLYHENNLLVRYPVSLGYLAAAIKKGTTWTPTIYNADFDKTCISKAINIEELIGSGFERFKKIISSVNHPIWKEITDVITKNHPDIIGITITSQKLPIVRKIIKIIRTINPKTVIIAGGPHPSLVKEKIFNELDIDLAVYGEAEKSIIEVINTIETKKELHAVKGLIFKHAGEIITNPPQPLIDNLDILDYPYNYAAETLHDFEFYPKEAFRFIMTTRGCHYNCTFCGSQRIWGNSIRYRSIEHVINELKLLLENGINGIRFDDDLFAPNDTYLTALCNAMLKETPGIGWECEMHVKQITAKKVTLMKEAGCYAIQIGVESGNNDILKKINKNITIEEAYHAAEIIYNAGIQVHPFFIVGFPWETEKTIQDTLTAIKKIKSDYLIYSIFTPYPGTELYDYCTKKGLMDSDNYYNHQSPENWVCENLSYNRFRELAKNIESFVDSKNNAN